MYTTTDFKQLHLDYQNEKGFYVPSNLPYCTQRGIEYFVGHKNNQALVTVFSDCERDTFEGIEPMDIKEMMDSAKTHGIDIVIIDTNFAVNIHSKNLKNYKGLHIVKTLLELTN